MVMYIRLLKINGYLDSLSGLYNRYQVSVYVNSLRSQLAANEKIAGIMFDVNRFKSINDSFGHVVGDKAIVVIGNIIKELTTKEGLGFRYGGDEFIIIFKIEDERKIIDFMNQFNQKVVDFNESGSQPFSLSLAMGYGVFDYNHESIDEFIDRMDGVMYKNKAGSR